MRAPPPGWPRMSASVFYDDPRAAIDWLCRAFGFEVQLKVEGQMGEIVHSELKLDEALVMVSSASGNQPWQARYRSPRAVGGGVTMALAFFVDDVDAHHARARAAGATIVRDLATTDYGEQYWIDRTYGTTDPEGHLWWFMQRLER